MYPECQCVDSCLPAITGYEVPLRLFNTTAVHKKQYPASCEKQALLQKELQGMLDAQVIQPLAFIFASLVTTVPKEDGTFRLCMDYHWTNLSPCAMLQTDEVINDISGCTIFSCMALLKATGRCP